MNQQRQEVQIRHYVQVEPPTPEFRILEKGSELSFIPLDAVWPDGNGNTSGRAAWDGDPKSYTQFRRGDILLPKVSPTFSHGRAMIADIDTTLGLASSEVYALRPHPQVDSRFISYALRSTHFLDEGTAAQTGMGGLRRVSTGWVKSYKLPLFSSGEQRRIADYLDRETRQIDETITRLDTVIELLETRNKAVIRSKVWLSDYPEVRLKWLIRETDKRYGNQPESEELSLLSVSIHAGVVDRSDLDVKQAASTDLSKYKVAAAGDIVLNRMRAFQGAVGASPKNGIVSPDYATYRVIYSERLSAQWAEFCMRTEPFLEQVLGALRGIGTGEHTNVRTPRINSSDFLELSIPLPNMTEQLHASSMLEVETRSISRMLEKSKRMKRLLEERRSALITAAVTGRIEV